MADKKDRRLGHDPLANRTPQGEDGLIRDTRNLSETEESVPMGSVGNDKAPSKTGSQPSEGRTSFVNVVKVVHTNPLAETEGSPSLSAESTSGSSNPAQKGQGGSGAQFAQDAHTASFEYDARAKRVKAPRINLVIEPWAEDYLKTMAGTHGISVTKYINQLIEADKTAKSEQYQAIKALIGKK